MDMKTTAIHRALVSVSRKDHLVDFARFLAGRGVEILSTGGTAKLLRDQGVAVKDVSEYTGSPEVMEGRVKTLHPRVHGGILARRSEASHLSDLERLGGAPIDLVVVNLYPFESVVANPGAAIPEAVENIDIGGPSMVRSASKNFESVTVVVDPADYAAVMAEVEKEGGVTGGTRRRLAAKAFQRTAQYDGAIARYLSNVKRGRERPGQGGGDLPRVPPPVLPQGPGPAVRGEPPAGGGLLPRTATASSVRSNSSRARSSPSTTSSTSRGRGPWRASCRGTAAPSSSTRTPAARAWARTRPRPSGGPS